MPLEPGEIDKPQSGYSSRFRHETEKAEPGYYAVMLEDSKVKRRVDSDTARRRTSLYLSRGRQARHLLVDLRSSIYDYPGKICGRA